jgi:hypothetical protein
MAVAIILALGAGTAVACALPQGRQINPVVGAGLRDTVKIEVWELNLSEPGGEPYVHRLSIADTQLLDKLVDALDTGLRTTLKVECMPDYELRFLLRDGRVQTFGYGCTGASFIRGEQTFLEGEDYGLP